MKRSGRLSLGFGLIVAALLLMVIEARLGITTNHKAGARPAAVGTPFAAAAPVSGARDVAAVRIGIDWPTSGLPALPTPPGGQVYRVAHARVRQVSAIQAPVVVDPRWFTMRDGRGLVAQPITTTAPGALQRQTLVGGATADGLLVYLVPTQSRFLGLVTTVPGAADGPLLWRVPQR